jgi:hypothetical protein
LSGNIGADGTVYFGSDNGPFYAVWGTSLGGFGESPWPASGQNVRRTGLAPSQPRILNQPNSQAVELGGTATLTAIAAGRPPLDFQWMLNGTPIRGATNTALVLTNLQAPKLGDYTLMITNSFGVVTSAPATLGLTLPAMPAALAIAADGQVRITGTMGGTYRLEATHDLGNLPWVMLTNLTLLSNPTLFSPGTLTNAGTTFYRAITTQ